MTSDSDDENILSSLSDVFDFFFALTFFFFECDLTDFSEMTVAGREDFSTSELCEFYLDYYSLSASETVGRSTILLAFFSNGVFYSSSTV